VAVYPDGTRDCPRCLTEDREPAQRVRGDRLTLCTQCEHAARVEASAGLAEMEPFMKQHLALTDWLIEHGQDPLAA